MEPTILKQMQADEQDRTDSTEMHKQGLFALEAGAFGEYLRQNAVWYRGERKSQESMRFTGELDANGIGTLTVHYHGTPYSEATVTPFYLVMRPHNMVKHTFTDTVTIVQCEWIMGLLDLTNALRRECYSYERKFGGKPERGTHG